MRVAMSEPKTAACKFIEAKTITIPGPGKFPEVEPTTVKHVKRDDEDKDDKEAALAGMSYGPNDPEVKRYQSMHGAQWKQVLAKEKGISPDSINPVEKDEDKGKMPGWMQNKLASDLMHQALKQAQNPRPYGTPKPSSATAAQKKMIADANKPPAGGTVGPRPGPGSAKSYSAAERKLFPQGHIGMTTPAGTGSSVAKKDSKIQRDQVVKRGNSPSPTDIGKIEVTGLGPTAETMAGLTGIPGFTGGSIGDITSGSFISKNQWLQVLAKLGIFAGGGAATGALVNAARGEDIGRGAGVGAMTGLGAMYGKGLGNLSGTLVGGGVGAALPVEGATATIPGPEYSSGDLEIGGQGNLTFTGEPITKKIDPTVAGVARGGIIGSGIGQAGGALGGGYAGYRLGQNLFGDEEEEEKQSAEQPAGQTPRHHCHGVHPDQTHEEWKASLEQDKGEKQSSLKRAFSAGRLGQWLEEPRELNPDEEEAAKRGKKRWRAPRGPNPELSEMMRSPWRSALGGAAKGGLSGGLVGAAMGGMYGAGIGGSGYGDVMGGAGTGALVGGAGMGVFGAGLGGVGSYLEQQETNEIIQQLMRHQSEERATVSDLERNMVEEEQRQREEWESRKQANADRVQEFVSQGMSLEAAVRSAYPSWSDEQVAEYVGQQKHAGLGDDAVKSLADEGYGGVTEQDAYNVIGGAARGAGIGTMALPGAIGALGGGIYGALAPGKNEEGEQRNRAVEALKRALIYGTLGAGAGVAGVAGGLGGGLLGAAGEIETIGEREGWEDFTETTNPDGTPQMEVKGSAEPGRACTAFRGAQFAQACG
jgi:hypothetical protein